MARHKCKKLLKLKYEMSRYLIERNYLPNVRSMSCHGILMFDSK